MGDVKNGLAFPYSERQLVNMTVGNLPEYIVAGDGVVEEILAGLQAAAWMAPRVHLKGKRAADDAVLLEQPRHGPAGGAVREVHKDTLCHKALVWAFDGIPYPARSTDNREQQ